MAQTSVKDYNNLLLDYNNLLLNYNNPLLVKIIIRINITLININPSSPVYKIYFSDEIEFHCLLKLDSNSCVNYFPQLNVYG